MESYDYLLSLAIILISTKLFSIASKKVNMPQVLGALIAGLILGPSILGMITENEFLTKTSEIGVIMLMFIAGLDTDLKQLKRTGLASAVIAFLGVLFPLGGGYLAYNLFFYNATDEIGMLKAIFLGVVLTATSVSITVETLREMGKLNGKVGTTIVGAAVIDDILGIVILTIISSLTDNKTKVSVALGKIALFFVFLAIFGTLIHYLFIRLESRHGQKRRTAVYAFSFCLFMAYSATTWFGVADIAGAYFAGLFLCNITKTRGYVASKMNIASYLIFSPVFFASMGIKTNLSGMNKELALFSLVFLIIAIITKIIGCGLGAKFCKFSTKDSLNVGIGMVSRGEVALVVAQQGARSGLISPTLFPAIILVVVITTIITPILLKVSMKDTNNDDSESGNIIEKTLFREKPDIPVEVPQNVSQNVDPIKND